MAEHTDPRYDYATAMHALKVAADGAAVASAQLAATTRELSDTMRDNEADE